MDHGVISFGVTVSQRLPSSGLFQIRPALGPAQSMPSRAGEGTIEYTTPRRGPATGEFFAFKASMVEGSGGFSRVKSWLIFSQCWPASVVLKTYWLPK